MSQAPRPDTLKGVTIKAVTPFGSTYITINRNSDNEPIEVFITIGKSGSDINGLAQSIARLISLCLRVAPGDKREGVLVDVAEELDGLGGSSTLVVGDEIIESFPDAIAKVLEGEIR